MQAAFGLALLGLLAVCHPQVAQAQFYYQQPSAGFRGLPRQGSVSKAKSNTYEREVDLGPFGLTQGVSNSRVVSKSNGGISVGRSNAISQGVNLGGLDVGGTLTRTQQRTNGQTTRGLDYDFNVGKLGFGASLSPTNLQNGFGLQRQPGGGVSLGLGLLNLDLTRNADQNNQAQTQAQVTARGRNARTRANSNSQTEMRQFGNIGVKTTNSQSTAVGRTKFGQTSASTGGLASNLATNAGTRGRGFYRERRALAQQFGGRRAPFRQQYRPRRDLSAALHVYHSEPFLGLQPGLIFY